MATIRSHKVVDDEYTEQTSYTIDLDLPSSGILSSLKLAVKARTTTTGLGAGPWIKYLVSSISVNQAGQAFLNAAPPAAFQADAYYKTGKMARRGYLVGAAAAAEIEEDVPILFVEHLTDMDNTIDLGKLNDPKVSVTYNLATTGPLGETIWDTSWYPRFTVIANLLQGEGIPVSKGYQSLRQIESYTPAASEIRKIELKGKRPIKRIYAAHDPVNCQYGWTHSLSEVKLYGDNEAWVPFLKTCKDWQEYIRDIYGLCNVKAFVIYSGNGATIDTCVDRRVNLSVVCHNSYDVIGMFYSGSGRTGKAQYRTIADGGVPAGPYYGMNDFTGYCPWSIHPIDMEKMLGMEYLDPTQHTPLYLELTHSSSGLTAGGPVRIYVEDLVKPQ